ncbi:MAG: Flp family type IVb pilin [Pirellulaceae bacterium]|nr:Flp family type IVb pilin [Pirellulaceae bacterium]
MKRYLKNIFSKLLREEDGPTSVEYCVMLAAILMVCFVTIATLGGVPGGLFSNADTLIRNAMNN